LSNTHASMKDRISITLGPEFLIWIDKCIEDKQFANRSHALEYLLYQKRKQEGGVQYERQSHHNY